MFDYFTSNCMVSVPTNSCGCYSPTNPVTMAHHVTDKESDGEAP